MKKILFLALVLSLALGACKKDGIPQHNQKIATITSTKEVYCRDQLLYAFEAQRVEQWNWDGNQLYRIDYSEDNETYSENFYYKHRRIASTTVPAYGLRSEMTYDGRHLQRIDVYQDDKPLYAYEFHREGRRISTVTLYARPDQEETILHAVDHLTPLAFSADLQSAMVVDLCKAAPKTDQLVGRDYQIEWDDDNNPVRISQQGGTAIIMRYDDKKNPLRQLYTLFALDDSDVDPTLELMGRHNIVEKSFEPNPDNSHFVYTYTYGKGGYPTESLSTHTYIDYDAALVLAEYTVKETRKYIYQ